VTSPLVEMKLWIVVRVWAEATVVKTAKASIDGKMI